MNFPIRKVHVPLERMAWNVRNTKEQKCHKILVPWKNEGAKIE